MSNPLTPDQKKAVKGFVADQLVSVVVKPIVHEIGDAMGKAKRPFWRKLVAFFRGK